MQPATQPNQPSISIARATSILVVGSSKLPRGTKPWLIEGNSSQGVATFVFWEWKNKICFKKEMLQHFRRMDLIMIHTLQFLGSKLHYMLLTWFILSNVNCYFYRFPYYLLQQHQICLYLQVGASPWRYDRWNFCSRSLQLFLQVSILLVHPATFSARLGWMHPIFGPDFCTRGIRFSCRHHLTISHDNQHHMKGTSSNVSQFSMSFVLVLLKFRPKEHLSPAGQPCWTAPAEALGRPLAIPPRIFSVIFFLDPLSHLEIFFL